MLYIRQRWQWLFVCCNANEKEHYSHLGLKLMKRATNVEESIAYHVGIMFEVRASQLAQASERVGSLIPASQQG